VISILLHQTVVECIKPLIDLILGEFTGIDSSLKPIFYDSISIVGVYGLES
jgi:hypothetical protein